MLEKNKMLESDRRCEASEQSYGLDSASIDHIYYINLEHRRDRNEEILDEFRKMEIPPTKYERFSAIYHNTIGGVGCGRSHVAVLEDAIKKGYKQIMVFEDDFQFCVSTAAEFQNAMQKLETMEYDVCLMSYHTEEFAETDNPHFRKVISATTTSGYIIKCHYFQKLADVFREASDNFEKTNYHWLYAIDVMWKPLQRADNWICFHPRLGKQRPSFSDCSQTYSSVDW